jgi:hypothetical protein
MSNDVRPNAVPHSQPDRPDEAMAIPRHPSQSAPAGWLGGVRSHPVFLTVKLLLLGGLAFLATARVIGIFLLPTLIDQNLLEAKVHQVLRYPDTNLVAIGPSYVDIGFEPGTFDGEMAALGGEQIHSFDLGLNGLSLIEMRALLERLFEVKPCCIKYVVMTPCYECLVITRNLDSVRSIVFFDWRHSVDFIRYILEYAVEPEEQFSKAYKIENILESMFRHYTNVGLISIRLRPGGLEEPDMLSNDFWDHRGTRGNGRTEHTMDAKTAAAYEHNMPDYVASRAERLQSLETDPQSGKYPNLVSEAMFQVFVDQVRFLRSKGVQVLVVIPPNTWWWHFHVAFIARLHEHCGDEIPFIDFGDEQRWPELFLPPSIREDDSHMNAKGAVIWSKILADQFAKAREMPLRQDMPVCSKTPERAAATP